MKKKIIKKYIIFMLSIILPINIYAVEVGMEYLYKLPSEGTANAGNYRFVKSSKKADGSYKELDKIYIKNGSSNSIAYCLEVEKSLKSGDSVSKLNKSLTEFLSSNSVKNPSLVAQNINKYIYFGYKTNDVTNRENDPTYVAAQLLIWEELSKNGFRTTEYNSVIPLRLTLNTANSVDMSAEKSKITSQISNYEKKPSFCSLYKGNVCYGDNCSSNSKKDVLELSVGSSKTFTDDNNIIKNYKVECSSGLECNINGNKLTVKMVNNTSNQSIKLVKAAAGSTTGATVYQGSGTQAIITTDARLEKVWCDIGINGYTNPQTSGANFIAILSLGILFGLITYIVYTNNYLKSDI